jgi:hypothetical protein
VKDTVPTTIDQFLVQVRGAFAEYEAAIASVPETLLTKAGTIGTWSVRDVMAHVGADQQWMAGQLEALRAGEEPTAMSCYGSDDPLPKGMTLNTQDERNTWQYERLRGLSLDEVRELASTGHARLIAAIESFRDEQLADVLTIANLGTQGHIRQPVAGEQGWPLWQWLAGVTYGHYGDHVESIRAVAARS